MLVYLACIYDKILEFIVQIGDPTFHHVESSVVIKFECANE
jgi:hypothetical protein